MNDVTNENQEVLLMAAAYTALAKAQAEFAPISRSKTVSVRTKAGGFYSFSYAPLEDILRATLPALNKNGFALGQEIEGDFLITNLYHTKGGMLRNGVKILVVDSGPQAYGSALTYARRYGVTLLLGVCADDDDDANAAEGNSAEVVAKPIDPRGEGHKHVPPSKAEGFAIQIRQALKVGIDQPLYELHLKLVDDGDLYIAVGERLSPAERREFKEVVERVRAKMREDTPAVRADGRNASAPR